MTIAEQLVKLNEAKQNIKSAIETKGVTVGDAPLADYAGKIAQISGGSSPAYGIDIASLIGKLDDNGILQPSAKKSDVDLTGVKGVAAGSFAYKFYRAKTIGSFSAPDITVEAGKEDFNYALAMTSLTRFSMAGLTSITGESALAYVCYQCSSLEVVDFPSLESVTARYALTNAFASSGVKRIEFPKLKSITTGYGTFYYTFYSCQKLVSVSFPELEEISGTNAIYYTFCSTPYLETVEWPKLHTIGAGAFGPSFNSSGIKRLDFPALTNIDANAFGTMAFQGASQLAEIHFRADVQAIVESMNGYASKWSAPADCQILFDL